MAPPPFTLDGYHPEPNVTPSTPQHPLLQLVLRYPRIAGRMAAKPETASFRRFSALNARNLLYMQAELCRLVQELLA